MLNTLGELGYLVEWRVVNAAEYGFPQRRIRVFILATKTRRKSKLSAEEADEVLFGSGVLARALPVEDQRGNLSRIELTASPDIISDEFGRGGDRSPFLNSGVYLNGIAFTVKSEAKPPQKTLVLGDVLVRDNVVPAEYWIPSCRLPEWEYLKGAKSVKRTHKESGTTYEYAEGKMTFPDLPSKPSRTILTGEGGTSPSRFKHVIKRPKGYRRLVPLELERLNGFPDNWTRFSSVGVEIRDGSRAFFMGNALVVGLIERVGAVLAEDVRSA
jgi:DNA (cytosine-5)-methyltransferase 1